MSKGKDSPDELCPPPGLRRRLRDGDTVICAGGFHRELEKRGYVSIGHEKPEVILQNPDVIKLLHEDLVHNGSDVVQAYTSYTHRLHLRRVGLEDKVEAFNRTALRIARQVADKTRTLMAGSLCSLRLYDPNDPSTVEPTKAVFKEQVQWALEEGADFVIGESFTDLGEAKLALECILHYDLPAVITLTIHCPEETTDNVSVSEALRCLEQMGAVAVGLNCSRGPKSMMPLLQEAKRVCKGPLAALPVPIRTTCEDKTWTSLKHPSTGEHIYPLDVEACLCSRKDIRQFAMEAQAAGIQYLGLCCGTNPSYIRELAEAFGKKPMASSFSTSQEVLKRTILYRVNPSPYGLKKRQFQLGTWESGIV